MESPPLVGMGENVGKRNHGTVSQSSPPDAEDGSTFAICLQATTIIMVVCKRRRRRLRFCGVNHWPKRSSCEQEKASSDCPQSRDGENWFIFNCDRARFFRFVLDWSIRWCGGCVLVSLLIEWAIGSLAFPGISMAEREKVLQLDSSLREEVFYDWLWSPWHFLIMFSCFLFPGKHQYQHYIAFNIQKCVVSFDEYSIISPVSVLLLASSIHFQNSSIN